MGNTVTVGKNIVIAYDGSPGNFSAATYFPGELLLAAVKLKGSVNDTVVVRHATGTGEILSQFTDVNGTGLKDSFRPAKWCIPYILASECILSNGAEVVLELA